MDIHDTEVPILLNFIAKIGFILFNFTFET